MSFLIRCLSAFVVAFLTKIITPKSILSDRFCRRFHEFVLFSVSSEKFLVFSWIVSDFRSASDFTAIAKVSVGFFSYLNGLDTVWLQWFYVVLNLLEIIISEVSQLLLDASMVVILAAGGNSIVTGRGFFDHRSSHPQDCLTSVYVLTVKTLVSENLIRACIQ